MQERKNPLVSIITVHFNFPEVTVEFLKSIKEKNTYGNIEIIIIDNFSDVDSSDEFIGVIPGITVLRNNKNLGFAGGNNVGIRQAHGEFLFLVNNDTEFTPGLIEGLLKVFDIKKNAGMVSPKFHYYYDKGIVEYAGYEKVNVFSGRNQMIGCRQPDNGQFNELKQTAYPHGGAMMVPAKIIDDVGALPEVYFLYYEEFDWAEQIGRKGYKVYYQPESLIYHKESMSTGKLSVLKTFYLCRNRILFMRRNMAFYHLFLFGLYFSFVTVPKNTLFFLVNRKIDHLKAFWKGILWQFDNSIIIQKK